MSFAQILIQYTSTHDLTSEWVFEVSRMYESPDWLLSKAYEHLSMAESSLFPEDAKLFSYINMPRHPLWVFFNCPYVCLRQSRVHAFDYQAPVVQKLDSAIQRIRITKNNCAIDPLDSNLSSGHRYPPFEQLGPGARFSKGPITLRARRQILKSKCVE